MDGSDTKKFEEKKSVAGPSGLLFLAHNCIYLSFGGGWTESLRCNPDCPEIHSTDQTSL